MESKAVVGFALIGALALSGCSVAEEMKMKAAAKDAVLARFADPSRVRVESAEIIRTGSVQAASTVCGTVTFKDAFGTTSTPIRFVRIMDGDVTLETDHGGYGKANVDHLCTGSTSDPDTARVVANTEAMIREIENDTK